MWICHPSYALHFLRIDSHSTTAEMNRKACYSRTSLSCSFLGPFTRVMFGSHILSWSRSAFTNIIKYTIIGQVSYTLAYPLTTDIVVCGLLNLYANVMNNTSYGALYLRWEFCPPPKPQLGGPPFVGCLRLPSPGPLSLWLAGHVFPVEIFALRKLLVTLSLTKTRWNTEAILKTYEFFMETNVILLVNFAKMCRK